MNVPHIALIGFGEVGVTLADSLDPGFVMTAWDLRFSDPGSGPSRAAATRQVRQATSADQAVGGASVVISAVTAAQTIEAARQCAHAIAHQAFFLDLNSASPQAKRSAADIINDAGARYVEAAVMTPIQPRRLAAPLLLGGPHASAFVAMASTLGFSAARAVSDAYGVAAATKLCRSIIVKGMEALLTESMLTARYYSVDDAVLASLDDFFPGVVWPELTRYMTSRAVVHGARRAEEMREAARMVTDAQIEPLLSEAIAKRQALSGALTEPAHQDLGAYLDDLRNQLGDLQPNGVIDR